MFGSENQRSAMRWKASGVHRLTIAMKTSTPSSSSLRLRARALGDRAFGLHDEPGRAEQRIAGDDAEPAEQRERRRQVERRRRRRRRSRP